MMRAQFISQKFTHPASATAARRPSPARGMTLVEMCVSTAVFSVVIMTLYGFMMTQAMVSVQEYSEQKTQHDTCLGVEQLIAQLETSKLHRIDSMGAWVQYSLPRTDQTTGSLKLDATGSVTFGVDLEGNWYPNGFWSAAFVRSNESDDYLSESEMKLVNPDVAGKGSNPTGYNNNMSVPVLPQAYIGVDLNGDGVIGGIFVGGYIQLTPYNAQGMTIGVPRMVSGKYFMELDPSKPAMTSHLTSNHGRLAYDDFDSVDQYIFPTTGNGDPDSVRQRKLDTMRYKNLGIFLMRHLNGVNAQQADPTLGAAGIDCDNFVDSNDNYIKDATESPVTNFHCSLTLRLATFDITRNLAKTGREQDAMYGLRIATTRVKLMNF